jgi:hypothetical protein
MGNACACVHQLEKDTRSYYSSAIVLLGREAGSGHEFLDSSITIRTQGVGKAKGNWEWKVRHGKAWFFADVSQNPNSQTMVYKKPLVIFPSKKKTLQFP